MAPTSLTSLYVLATIYAVLVSPTTRAQQPATVIKNAHVVDVKNGSVQRNHSIRIEGNTITAIGKRVTVGKRDVVLDAREKYVLPGLTDMHVHIRDVEQASFNLFLAHGVTSVRDMHNPFHCDDIGAWRDSINRLAIAPRVVAAAGCIVDGPGDQRGYNFQVVSTIQEGKATVQRMKTARADFIKVYSRLSPANYQAIMEEATKQNLPVYGHIPFAMPIRNCVEAGHGTIEHMDAFHIATSSQERNILDSIASDRLRFPDFMERCYSTYDSSKLYPLGELLNTNDVWICPTLAVDFLYYLHDHVYSARGQQVFARLPPNVNGKWKRPNAIVRSSDDSVLYAGIFYRELSMLGTLSRAGTRIIAGTDASPVRYVIPGFSLHEELKWYVRAGLTPLGAIQTATINPALSLKQEGKFGSIEKGKVADLIILDGNPLEDIAAIDKISAVVVRGSLLHRKDLDQLLTDADNLMISK